ncbi:MAG: hypothetical protein LBI10_13235 [Deltaproteobacteria bacterium]|jgi:hypothetical protein|nr:hypothetical protein [Deltaproteobacteria bacterium]
MLLKSLAVLISVPLLLGFSYDYRLPVSPIRAQEIKVAWEIGQTTRTQVEAALGAPNQSVYVQNMGYLLSWFFDNNQKKIIIHLTDTKGFKSDLIGSTITAGFDLNNKLQLLNVSLNTR